MNAIRKVMEVSICFKLLLNSNGDGQDNEQNERLSRDVVKLLRGWLPDSGKPFDQNDGSLLLEDVVKLLKHSPERILKAILIQRGQKIRVVAFDKFNKHRKERRICALGGHFFLVKNR